LAINRAPFNALVDDAGTGLTGSIWNKAAIQSVILDPADAAFGPGVWTPVTFNAANFWTGVTGAAPNKYIVIGKMLIWMCGVNSVPSPPAGPYCPFTIPGAPMLTAGQACFSGVGYAVEGGAVVAAQAFDTSPTVLSVRKVAGGNWSGTLSITFTVIAALQ
jgi:hypothetical protein